MASTGTLSPRAARTRAAVISSGLEAPKLREFIDEKLLVITPGIRPVDNKPTGDQKRVVSVEQAFRNGADHIVVGRPIRDAKSPRAAAEAIQVQPVRGAFPRNINLSPDGGWLLAAGADSNTVAVHQVDAQTGELTYQTKNIINVPSPICILFVKP